MENIKLPAFPLPLVGNAEGEVKDASDWGGNVGFTKLELASLMIAAGWLGNIPPDTTVVRKDLAESSVLVAKAILEEANK